MLAGEVEVGQLQEGGGEDGVTGGGHWLRGRDRAAGGAAGEPLMEGEETRRDLEPPPPQKKYNLFGWTN